MSEKKEMTVIVFCVRMYISAQMGGIGPVILKRTEKRKIQNICF